MKQSTGFTLIELVIVIVILGILAAVAVPKYLDLRKEAQEARIKGIAGAIAAGTVINHARCMIGKGGKEAPVRIRSCNQLNSILRHRTDFSKIMSGSRFGEGSLKDFVITGGRTGTSSVSGAEADNGTVLTCTLQDNSSSTPLTEVVHVTAQNQTAKTCLKYKPGS